METARCRTGWRSKNITPYMRARDSSANKEDRLYSIERFTHESGDEPLFVRPTALLALIERISGPLILSSVALVGFRDVGFGLLKLDLRHLE